uniref:Uncharacterized protein n=1 Tax=Nelumbo nucifera TaxID=4432 RepID=A0A822ZNQ7_NELNU|nr:TPA_asm: hypothetical protein HUJ06_016798 [Nelumbo nucifera]
MAVVHESSTVRTQDFPCSKGDVSFRWWVGNEVSCPI